MTMTAARPARSASPRRRPVLRVLLLLLALLMVWVGSVAFRVWWVARGDDRTPVDAVVVLGASQYDGDPSPVFAGRLDHAVELYDEGVAPEVVTVGSNLPGDRFTEAGSGKEYLIQAGVPADAIDSLPVGHDTWRSLQAVDALAERRGWQTLVLVTDPWHEFRSREMAEALGMDVNTSPTRTGPIVQERITEVKAVIRETAAYVWWRMSGGAPWSGPDLD
ncbi:MAG TPA: YdcF family protein [Actinomycetes bacterium]|nr:YdcF family protein [Actinomycetes bacterium]